jgi:hypothetical protein
MTLETGSLRSRSSSSCGRRGDIGNNADVGKTSLSSWVAVVSSPVNLIQLLVHRRCLTGCKQILAIDE